ncbi:MAG: hypothetical protein H7Z72_25145 [Bacteroidetes bacterium]|nr:hypothetical protein [Fibrella sp.]
MKISRQDYDRLPFAIREGALRLWGTQLSSCFSSGQFRRLYSFSNFFAEMRYDEHHLISIRTFSTTAGLEPYIEDITWQDFLN